MKQFPSNALMFRRHHVELIQIARQPHTVAEREMERFAIRYDYPRDIMGRLSRYSRNRLDEYAALITHTRRNSEF
jgi:hypothetical protein